MYADCQYVMLFTDEIVPEYFHAISFKSLTEINVSLVSCHKWSCLPRFGAFLHGLRDLVCCDGANDLAVSMDKSCWVVASSYLQETKIFVV